MSLPLALLQPRVSNEAQDQVLDTVKLFPNSTNQVQTRFVIPKQGTILDSNSTLAWYISWDGYDSTKDTDNQLVLLKNPSGGLMTIRRARFYVGSKLIFVNEDVGGSVALKYTSHTPDYRHEVDDVHLGSQNAYFVEGTNGKVQLSSDVPVDKPEYKRYCRALGKYSEVPGEDSSIQCSLKLKDIFSGLRSIQLPISELDECRLEIDWETSFDEVAYIFRNSVDAITNTTIRVENPTLLLDYLTVDEESALALKATMMEGVPLPFVHTSVSEKQIPAVGTNQSEITTDVLLALQGKLLMKMYVSHRLNDTNAAGNVLAPQRGCGRARSQRNIDFKYQLLINDLAIHDQPVDSSTMSYSFLELAKQRPVSIMAGQYDRNRNAAVAITDVVSDNYTPCGQAAAAANGGLTATEIRDMVAGNQAYIGFDLSKFDEGSDIVPSNAGYRVGSSAVILRLSQAGNGTADSQSARTKTVQVFTEEVRILQMRGGQVDVFEA